MVKKLIRQILGVAVLEGKVWQRQPLWIFQGIITVLGLTITLFAWGGGSALRNLVIAFFVTGGWTLGLNIVAQNIGWDKVNFFYEHYVASPITLPIYFTGMVLGAMPIFLVNVIPALIIFLILAMDFSLMPSILMLSVLSAILGAFISLSVILRMKNPANISAITNPLLTLTIMLPPIYYPLSLLPPIWREIVLIVPTVPLMELSRWLVHIPIGYTPILSLTLLLLWLVLATILVLKKLNWGLE